MKKLVLFLFLSIFFIHHSNAQGTVGQVIGTVKDYVNGSGKSVTNDEVVKGLREALSVGTKKATSKAAVTDGFFKNTLIKIPFPPEAKAMETKLIALGLKPRVDEFVKTLNRAAEKAAKDAAPIFLKAITSITISDGVSVLKGGDRAATSYLEKKTTGDLKVKFLPVVKTALQQVQITKYWTPLTTAYNRIPTVKKLNPDLNNYVTGKAIEGLFKLIAQEELKIRKDPASRISELLKKVFG